MAIEKSRFTLHHLVGVNLDPVTKNERNLKLVFDSTYLSMYLSQIFNQNSSILNG